MVVGQSTNTSEKKEGGARAPVSGFSKKKSTGVGSTFILDFLACSFLACFSLASFSPAQHQYRFQAPNQTTNTPQGDDRNWTIKGMEARENRIVLWRSNSYCFFLLARLFFFDMFLPSPSPPTTQPTRQPRKETRANPKSQAKPSRAPSSLPLVVKKSAGR